MAMGTWESFLYTGPASAALANELWKGNAQPALDLLPKAVAAVKGDPSENYNPWWTVGYIFGAPIFDTNWRWEQGQTFDTTALVKLYEAMAVQMPALALVIGNTMAGIEFQAAGDEHGRLGEKSCAIISLGAYPDLRPF